MMKQILAAVLLVISCSAFYSQQFPTRGQDPNADRFKDPEYNPVEDSLLRMNHFMTEIWEPEVVNVQPEINFSDLDQFLLRTAMPWLSEISGYVNYKQFHLYTFP